MTARMMSMQMNTEIQDRTAARAKELCFFKAPAFDVRVARMDSIERIGDYDRTEDGLIRLRSGMIGDERMTATVQSQGGELLVTFGCAARNHQRRILVDALGTYIMDADGKGVIIGANNKYWVACNAIWTARAH